MENTFEALGLKSEILKAVGELGFVTPTKVQAESIPAILNGEDLIVMSKTGSGKTGAFGLPILNRIEGGGALPKALILAPTRELAVQVEKDIRAMSKHLKVKSTAIYGQHNMNTEIDDLKKGVDIVVGTPGRVMDHIKRRTLVTKEIEFLVLDEADRMLDMGFIDQVVQIIKGIPNQRNTLLFSATMPVEIQNICIRYMNSPKSIELESAHKTVDTIEQLYYKMPRDQKRTQLDRVLKVEQPDSCMIFANTRIEVDRIQAFLYKQNYVAEALHGDKNQSRRMKTIEKFKEGKIQILVATDVAARGIHIDELSLVINYDIPEDRNSYVHRIGRTGRAGNSGRAISFVTSDDFMLLYEIEENIGVLIDEGELPTDEAVEKALAEANGRWVGVIPPKQSHQIKAPEGTKRKASTTNRSKGDRLPKHKDEGARSHGTTKPTHKKHPAPKHEQKPTAYEIREEVGKTLVPKDKPLVPNDKVTTKKTKVTTRKEKVGSLGDIEFIVREKDKKEGVLGRLKKLFSK